MSLWKGPSPAVATVLDKTAWGQETGMVEGGLLFHVGRSLRVKLGWDSVLCARCGSAPSWPAEAVPGVSFVQQFLHRAFSVLEDIETERAPGPGLATFPHRHRRARCTLNLSLIFGSLHLLPTPPRTPLSYPQPPSWPFSPPGSYLLRRHLLHGTSPSVARGPFPPTRIPPPQTPPPPRDFFKCSPWSSL